MSTLLEIKGLQVDFAGERGLSRAVDGVSLRLEAGDSLGLVGESGSGKSVTALSVMRLLQTPPARMSSGEILYHPRDAAAPLDLLRLPVEEMQKIRGREIGMVFQEPMTSLNPVFTCGQQVAEAIQIHRKIADKAIRELVIELFRRVQLPEPERIYSAYPHQISGGQKQRVMIAMAISCQPSLLIADEPTTALDVTVQKAILSLLLDLKSESGLSMLFISHDLGVIAEVCNRVAVMYQGRVVEEGAVQQILNHPQHPYTKGLLACRPSMHRKLHRLPTIADYAEGTGFKARVVTRQEQEERQQSIVAGKPVLEVEKLQVRYPGAKNWLGITQKWRYAVDDVSFEVFPGETFGLAGESGCGKTTLGRAITRLIPAYSGNVRFQDKEWMEVQSEDFRKMRRQIQMVFQDPYASLNPKMPIGQAIVEPMEVHRLHDKALNRRDKAIELLETVGLSADHFNRYPHEFSGGQRQRICIARALALEPRFLVCDEMVSALDVSVQATILNLMMELQEKFGLTYLFISHDLSVIQQMCDRLLVMNQGKIDCIGTVNNIYSTPPTPYVQRLLEAISDLEKK